ncbi:MAG: hypothetical protein KGZ96_10675 [Clostridia bacterium]|jgi:hypothetical protein|nr:hypothetical protein [Clostridia bacterium]
MVEYTEIKDFLCRVIGKKETDEANCNIIVDISRNRYNNPPLEEERQFIVYDQELLDMYNRTISMQYDGITLYSDSYYEVAIDLDYPMRHRDVYFLK